MTTIEERRRRHGLEQECRAAFTPGSADELMASIAPPGWGWDQVATKADVAELKADIADVRADAKADVAELKAAIDAKFDVVAEVLTARFQRDLAVGLRRNLQWTVTAVVGTGALDVVARLLGAA